MPTASQPRDRTDVMLAFIGQLHPERDVTAKAVAWRLRRAAHRIDTGVRRRLATKDMELWELEILCALRRAGGSLSMGELLDVAQLTSGAITNRIGRLERHGYVRREMDPADRRAVLVTITPGGLDRAAAVVDENNTVEQEIFAGIDPELLRRIGTDLRELLLALEGPVS